MAMLTAAIVSSTRALAATRTSVDQRIAASAAARQGLEAIVAALRNVRRDPDKDHPLILGESSGPGSSRIELQVISDARARHDSPECDQYELGFTVWQREGDGVPVLLCRRKNALTDKPGAGGIATVVAEGIVGLSFQYYSQGQWQDEWTEDELGIPEAVRVTVAAVGIPARASAAKVTPVALSMVVSIHAQPPTDTPQSGDAAKSDQQGDSKQSGENQSKDSSRSGRSSQGNAGSTGGSR